MLYRSRQSLIKFIYALIDVVCIYFSIYAACFLRQEVLGYPLSFPRFLLDQDNPFQIIFHVWILTTIFFANNNNLYQTRREILEGIEIWHVIKSISQSSLVTIVAIFLLKIHDFPRTIFLLSALFMVLSLSLWRVVKRKIVEYLVIGGYNNFNVLIVGAGKVGVALVEEIRKRPGLGLRIVGFLDDFKTEHLPHQVKILGRLTDFPEIAQREFIDKVFITTHHDSTVFLNLLEQARDMGLAIRVIPQGFDLTSGELFKYNIGLIPILEYSDVITQRKQTGKRLFDFIFSLILFITQLPFFILISLLIKLDSPGPIFYVSKRYGKNGKIFSMYKFRSMVQDADRILAEIKHKNEMDGPIFKIKEDPRMTKIGRFLRRYSLDECPQIINVLKGEMSLVGPRPLPIEQIEKEDLRQLKRLGVRPGITGLWQIRGRNDISFFRLVKWDIWYIDNWSFWLDMNILLQTIPVVLQGKGAY